jgi:cytochrome c556
MKPTLILSVSASLAAALVLIGVASPRSEAAAAKVSKAEADGIIFERQNIMLQLEKDTELLGEIVARLKPADQLPEVTRSIAESAAALKPAFEPRVPGGRSKPEVWSKWPDYAQRLDSFESNAKRIAELGAKNDLHGVTDLLGGLPCKECHDVYRAPKK